MPRPSPILRQDFIDIRFHALFVAVQDAPVQALLRGHPQGRISCSILLACAHCCALEIFNKALQCIRPAVEK